MERAPVTFVTGKGGVGKTTIVSLLSTTCASRGERVLVVSLYNDTTTHKLFGTSPDTKAGHVQASTLEDVDIVISTPSSALSSYFTSKKLGSVTSKLTHAGLLEAVANTVPGMRELLTIGDIRAKAESKKWDRIIVDTPSTGHAQSLFDIANMARSTARSGLIRQQAESAQAFLNDQEQAQALVVTLDHVMPLSECRDFVFSLEENMNIFLAGIVVNRSNVVDDTSSSRIDRELKDIYLPIFAVAPHHTKSTRKSALSRFTSKFQGPTLPKNLSQSISFPPTTQTVVVLGTGGVGKTTTSAAIAISQAREKKKVALLTIDPARRLGTALGLENTKALTSTLDPHNLSSSEKANLHVFQLDSREEFMGMLESTLSKREFKKIKKNTFVQGISRAGIINEFMAIEAMHRLSISGQYDLIVVDTPPSHHVFDLLDAPSTLQRVFHSPIFRTLVGAGTITGWGANMALKTFFKPLQVLVGAELISDTVEFLQTIRDVEDIFSQHSQAVAGLLHSPSTHYVGVCRPVETSREQIMTVARDMRLRGYDFSTIVINGLDPAEFDIDNEIIPFVEYAHSRGISVASLPEYERDEPVEIVQDMAKDIVS